MNGITTQPPKFNVEELFPFLKERARKATRLHPRRQSNINPLGSKIGGAIAWPENESHPICPRSGCNAVSFLQVQSKDVTLLEFPEGADLLQILWFPDEDSLYGQTVHANEEDGAHSRWFVYWRNSTELSSDHLLLPTPNTVGGLPVTIEECSIQPEIIVEYPSLGMLGDLSAEDYGLLTKWNEENDDYYQRGMSVCPGVKIGGYPDGWEGIGPNGEYIPKTTDGEMQELLLTFSDSEFGEGWQPNEIESHSKTGGSIDFPAGSNMDYNFGGDNLSDEEWQAYNNANQPLNYDFPDPFNLFIDRSEEPNKLIGVY